MNIHLSSYDHHEPIPAMTIRPLIGHSHDGQLLLHRVIVESHQPHADEIVELSPDQVLSIQATLSQAVCGHAQHAVLVEAQSPDGRPVMLQFTPAQVPLAAHELELIALEYLHENAWGGEDARIQ
jgi:hypothetical protein